MRGAVSAGRGYTFREVHHGQHGVIGLVQTAAHLVLAEAPGLRRQGQQRRDGLAIVLPGLDAETARLRCQELLPAVRGLVPEGEPERLEVPFPIDVHYLILRAP
jgi:hypothetical protein